jgi:hypothetical protein
MSRNYNLISISLILSLMYVDVTHELEMLMSQRSVIGDEVFVCWKMLFCNFLNKLIYFALKIEFFLKILKLKCSEVNF